MGCGKSTLGKKLANRLDVPFLDADKEIEKKYNKSIGEIFTEFGESHFRDLEARFIESIANEGEFVLATGGGMPCFANNLQKLKDVGITFYLERSPKELAHRLINAKEKRPLIEGLSEQELLSFIEDRLHQREDYYKAADVVLHRDEQTPETIQRLLHHLHPELLQKS